MFYIYNYRRYQLQAAGTDCFSPRMKRTPRRMMECCLLGSTEAKLVAILFYGVIAKAVSANSPYPVMDHLRKWRREIKFAGFRGRGQLKKGGFRKNLRRHYRHRYHRHHHHHHHHQHYYLYRHYRRHHHHRHHHHQHQHHNPYHQYHQHHQIIGLLLVVYDILLFLCIILQLLRLLIIIFPFYIS